MIPIILIYNILTKKVIELYIFNQNFERIMINLYP